MFTNWLYRATIIVTLSSAFALPLSATQFGVFSYKSDGKSISITGCDYNVEGVISIPETIIGLPVRTISKWAFSRRRDLTEVIIPKSVTRIDDGAFMICWNLTTVHLPPSLRSMGDDVFQYCERLTTVTIPKHDEEHSKDDV